MVREFAVLRQTFNALHVAVELDKHAHEAWRAQARHLAARVAAFAGVA